MYQRLLAAKNYRAGAMLIRQVHFAMTDLELHARSAAHLSPGCEGGCTARALDQMEGGLAFGARLGRSCTYLAAAAAPAPTWLLLLHPQTPLPKRG